MYITEENTPIYLISLLIALIYIFIITIIGSCISNCDLPSNKKYYCLMGIIVEVLCILYVWLLYTQYIPNGIERNNQIDLSATECIVYKVEKSVNVNSGSIDYIAFYTHYPDNINNTYTGSCSPLISCYPSIGTNITCYPYENGYSTDTHYTNISRLQDHLIWGYVQLVLASIPLILFSLSHYRYCIRLIHRRNLIAVSPIAVSPIAVSPIVVSPIAVSQVDNDQEENDQEENDQEEEDQVNSKPVTCAICMTRKPCYMFESCRHICLCKQCNKSYTNYTCVICRTNTQRILVFL